MTEEHSALMPTYDRIPVEFKRGEGPYLFDTEGNRYLDALAGIAVNILGYRHPKLVDAARRAVDGVRHVSNLFEIEAQETLARELRSMGFPGRAFFANSGAEANEAAIKFARKYQYRRDSSARTILTFEQSFHGRTLGALAATGQTKYHEGFEPLPEGFDYVPFNDPDAVEQRMDDDVAGIMVEPIQGEGGLIPAEESFLERLRELCDEHDALLMFDEVQAGMGRTGSFYAFQEFGVEPDLICLAKGIANGYPMGATLAHESLDPALQSGDHASTFGGSPFVSAMALEVVSILKEEEIPANVVERSAQLQSGLDDVSSRFDHVGSPRGMGLMLGLPLHEPMDATEVMHQARDEGLIIGTAGDNVLRFVPPLILTQDNVDELLEKLTVALSTYEPED